MLDFEAIIREFPVSEQSFKRNILREYLQYLILDILYKSQYGHKLIFLGGTALRIIHGNNRFSEDLDFDNVGLTEDDFTQLSNLMRKELELEGYAVEIKQVLREAYHCYIRFPDVLYTQKLSPLKNEKILIQLDAEPQKYDCNPVKHLLKKFGLFRFIPVAPASTLLSQKIAALLGRKRGKGRDYFDVTFLFSKTTPDFGYLSQKLSIENIQALKNTLLDHTASVDLKKLADDVRPFLIKPDQVERVLLFRDFVETL